jgi:aquaporin Z
MKCTKKVLKQEDMSAMKQSFNHNWKLYIAEAVGLAIFMISACFFSALLESKTSALHNAIADTFIRSIIMGVLMGLTALLIFYMPFTSVSGSHINPAVTITFHRLGKISQPDLLFYILFQFIGATAAVYLMAFFTGDTLTMKPVNYAATVPGKYGITVAFLTEFFTAFIMMSMVLFTSAHPRLKKYTRLIAGFLVCMYVIIAGPLSGFGMNPARTFASALPSNTWTAFWIYMTVPVSGMLSAAELFVWISKAFKQHDLKLSGLHMYHPAKMKHQ